MNPKMGAPAMALAAVCVAGAGRPTWFAKSPVVTAIAEVDSLYFDGRPAAALGLCEEAFASGEDNIHLRWRATRAAIAVGMVRPHGPEQFMLFDRAIDHARHAVALAPGDLDAKYWLGAALGIRAQEDDPIYSARLALEAYELGSAVLAADSNHAGAHHLVGMLHASVSRVPALVRFVAGRILRMDVARTASPREAERHLRRAVELAPDMVLYLADLSLFYESRQRHVNALVFAQQLERTPSRHPADEYLRALVRQQVQGERLVVSADKRTIRAAALSLSR